uniref:C-type lectin domain-containing protein n=1 Tax=Seriola lalandi dorsalis TaxID=1841481 RepID=A0A3B4XN56_SERLL
RCHRNWSPSHQYRRYVHHLQQVTWSEAQTYCREHHTDLATFHNMHELDAAQSLYSSHLMCWIGLRRHNNDPGVWRWSDGRPDNFTHWNVNSNEPNGREKDMQIMLDKFTNPTHLAQHPLTFFQSF